MKKLITSISIILACLFLFAILAVCYLQTTYPVRKYFIVRPNYNEYIDFRTGKKGYKVGNNSYAVFNHINVGDSIDMPNMFGCSQVILYKNNKILIIHYTPDLYQYNTVKMLLEKHMDIFKDDEIPDVEFSFGASKPEMLAFYKKHIQEILAKKFKKIPPIHYTIYDQTVENDSFIYVYYVHITKDGLKSETIKRNDIYPANENTYFMKPFPVGQRIALQTIQHDMAIILYQNNKIIVLRRDFKTGQDLKVYQDFLEKSIKSFSKNKKVQLILILPKNSYIPEQKILKSYLEDIILKNFRTIDSKTLYYKNNTSMAYYSGFLRQDKIIGRIKPYLFGNLKDKVQYIANKNKCNE